MVLDVELTHNLLNFCPQAPLSFGVFSRFFKQARWRLLAFSLFISLRAHSDRKKRIRSGAISDFWTTRRPFALSKNRRSLTEKVSAYQASVFGCREARATFDSFTAAILLFRAVTKFPRFSCVCLFAWKNNYVHIRFGKWSTRCWNQFVELQLDIQLRQSNVIQTCLI